ncbi:hypothetical protein DFJ73DRAFT_829207, partial [Zopfochytrium polystomum]
MAGRQQFLVIRISVYCAGASRACSGLQQKKKAWTRLKTGAALIEQWMIERCESETITNFQAIKGQVSASPRVGRQVAVADHADGWKGQAKLGPSVV